MQRRQKINQANQKYHLNHNLKMIFLHHLPNNLIKRRKIKENQWQRKSLFQSKHIHYNNNNNSKNLYKSINL